MRSARDVRVRVRSYWNRSQILNPRCAKDNGIANAWSPRPGIRPGLECDRPSHRRHNPRRFPQTLELYLT